MMKVARKSFLNVLLEEVFQGVRPLIRAFILKTKKEYVYINSVYIKIAWTKRMGRTLTRRWRVLDKSIFLLLISFHPVIFLKKFICGVVKISVNLNGDISISSKYCYRFSCSLAETPLRDVFSKNFSVKMQWI